jgi:hypothetical protein
VKGLLCALSALVSCCVEPGPLSGAALAAPAVSVIEVGSSEELREKFCVADPLLDHVLILPAALFVDSEELVCPVGSYRLYRIIEHDDPDDFEYFIDPPFGAEGRLGCDGKAGRAMKVVALNCRPE